MPNFKLNFGLVQYILVFLEWQKIHCFNNNISNECAKSQYGCPNNTVNAKLILFLNQQKNYAKTLCNKMLTL